MKIKRHNNQGFTIVELVIVIVIIGILTAIGLVTYNGLTDRAKKAQVDSAVSNLSNFLDVYYAEEGKYPNNGTSDLTNFKTAKLPGGIKTTGADEDAGWKDSNGNGINLRYFKCADSNGDSGYVIQYKYPSSGNWENKKVGTTPNDCFDSSATAISLYQ